MKLRMVCSSGDSDCLMRDASLLFRSVPNDDIELRDLLERFGRPHAIHAVRRGLADARAHMPPWKDRGRRIFKA